MNKVKRLAVALLAMVIGIFAFCFVACDEETPTPPPAPEVNISVAVAGDNLTYTGSAITPAVTVKDGETALTLDTDYTLSYTDNVNAGTGKVTVTFKGRYEGETAVEKTFTIGAKAITPTVADIEAFTYDGTAKAPVLTVKDGETTLVKDTDYTVAYANNVNAGTAKATVTLKGNYSGSAEKEYTINKAQVAKPAADSTVFTYNGSAQTYTVAENELYVVSGTTQTNAGSYSVTVALEDKNNYEWADGTDENLTYEFKINPFNASAAVVTVSEIVEGEEAVASVELEDFELTESDYVVTLDDNTTAGQKVAAVEFRGNFTGTATVNYTVKSIADNVTALFDFNYDIKDRKNNKTATVIGEVPEANYASTGSGTAIKLVAGRKTAVKIENAPLGTEDFTVAFTAKFDMADINSGTNEGNALFETGSHVAADCNGISCSNKACNGTANDVVKMSLTRSSETEYKLRVNFAKDPNTTKTNVILTADQLALIKDATTGEGKWFTVTLVMDRKVSVTATTETATASVYLNDKLLAKQNIEYAISGGNYCVLGDGNIYLGGYTTWTSGGGVKYRDREIDSFVLYNGALNEQQVKNNLPAYVESVSNETDWSFEPISFSFMDVNEQNKADGGYDYALTALGTKAHSGITLKNAPDGVSLKKDGNNYTLQFTADGLTAIKSIDSLVFTAGGVDKEISVSYILPDSITASSVMVYDFEISDTVTKIITVKAETIGITGATFSGDLAGKITETATAGEYALTLTKAEAEALAATTQMTASYDGVSAVFTVNKANSLAKKTGSYTGSNVTGPADLTLGASFGTESFTVGFNVSIPAAPANNTPIDIFATSSARSGGTGVRVSMKKNNSTYQFCIQFNGYNKTIYSNSKQESLAWITDSHWAQYLGKTVPVVVEFDRSTTGKLEIFLYVDGTRLNADSSYSNVWTLTNNALDVAPDDKLVFGYGGTSTTSSSDCLAKSFGVADGYLVNGLVGTELTAALQAKIA